MLRVHSMSSANGRITEDSSEPGLHFDRQATDPNKGYHEFVGAFF